MNGKKPTSETVTISNGQVENSSTMTIGDYKVSYNPTTKKYEATETGDDKPTTPDTPSTTVVYSWSEDSISLGVKIDPNDTAKFTKDASTLGKSYYLKHVLDKDNKVTESYACAILKGKEYCLTNGEYGYAANSSDYTGNALLLKQIEDAKIEGISCTFDAIGSYCDFGSVDLRARSKGNVSARDGVDGCYVYGDGSSVCESY